MNKLGNIFQVLYIIFAAIFLYQVVNLWGSDRQMALIFLFAAAMAIFKFFFNRKYRKRFDEYYKNKNKNK
ncbi:hypothetical protein [Pseudofulvibacter geojedonensis]|uniref:Uncharacterized protein n=1 Tax=Pseudofulvibacter geojedonensis TaxID=1123758 RepID=A0ABW3I3A4_9FLAO